MNHGGLDIWYVMKVLTSHEKSDIRHMDENPEKWEKNRMLGARRKV